MSGISRSYGNSMFTFSRKGQTVFYKDCFILSFQQQNSQDFILWLARCLASSLLITDCLIETLIPNSSH
jgi:hypothetical protein